MGKGNFFAMISRMQYIDRWALMRNTRQENLSEHSLMAAVIAHALCVIGNRRLHKNLDENGPPSWPSTMTRRKSSPGICPPPCHDNPAIRQAYQQVEQVAGKASLHVFNRN